MAAPNCMLPSDASQSARRIRPRDRADLPDLARLHGEPADEERSSRSPEGLRTPDWNAGALRFYGRQGATAAARQRFTRPCRD